MRKIKFYLETGYVGATHTDIVEYPDDTEDSEIEEDLESWKVGKKAVSATDGRKNEQRDIVSG